MLGCRARPPGRAAYAGPDDGNQKAMEYLLSRKKLDDIPVSEIAKMAGVSRRTFYRHFCDKYELVNWYYDEFYEESFGSIVLGAGLEEAPRRTFSERRLATLSLLKFPSLKKRSV